jgi:hypothetical protein
MKIRYSFARFSKEERDFWSGILLEEMDIQRWFTVTSCHGCGGEILLSLQ